MTDSKLTRRDALKLLAIASAGIAFRPFVKLLSHHADAATPNILIFVFDAWTAANVQFYGYPRRTMPNLERFTERATVYHNHYSAGSYTVPGTASILTGLYPWTHRALILTAGGVIPAHASHNIFAAFSESRKTFGFSQNPFADCYLDQFSESIDVHLNRDAFNLESSLLSDLPIFSNDSRMAFTSIEENVVRSDVGPGTSMYVGPLWKIFSYGKDYYFRKKYLRKYGSRLPAADGANFFIDRVVTGGIEALQEFSSPTMAYFHFFPPHEPYAPTRKFSMYFDDGWNPPAKPIHPLSTSRSSVDVLNKNRLWYDQYLASWDEEIGRLLDYLHTSGLMDNSIIVFTSDHGELFERGEVGHLSSILARAVVWTPLLISLPGQTTRKDFYSFTSSVDLLPTLAHLVGSEIPDWVEGSLLPGFGGQDDEDRSAYSIISRSASSYKPITAMSLALMKQRHRLIYYSQEDERTFEFYNLDDDPDEMTDLYPSRPALAQTMQEELLQKIEEFNRPYRQ